MKALYIKRLKVNYEELLSKNAFKFNLRRYTTVLLLVALVLATDKSRAHQVHASHGRAVQVNPVKPMLKPPGTKRLNLKCDIPLSTFAFKFYLRHYTKGFWSGKSQSEYFLRWRSISAESKAFGAGCLLLASKSRRAKIIRCWSAEAARAAVKRCRLTLRTPR